MNKTFQNPILSGFYPDPSICRVGDDYYLATSSFCYFPGIPIFHSKDLVHWEQIGHAIHRPDQIDYSRCAHSEGLWAPSLRYHNGKFYLINTFVFDGREGGRANYIVTAEDPAGPWSDPIFVEGADGIDSSLFFDDDGSVWYCGNYISKEEKYQGHHGIYLCELDPETLQFKGERTIIWDGIKTRSKWIEAPHIYKINGMYYLIVAEGGTFANHSVMMARCDTIDGDYEICPRNPIVSHRNLSMMHPISVTGHADIVETQNGEWWMVLLAVRPYTGVHFNLGRETFLIPIVWDEDGWPRVDNENGLVNATERFPNLPVTYYPVASPNDHFENSELSMIWNFTRSINIDFYSLTERESYLRLHLRPTSIAQEHSTPAFIARRQQHKLFGAGTAMEFTPENEKEEAGICMAQNHDFNYLFTVQKRDGKRCLVLSKHCNDSEFIRRLHLGVDNTFAEHKIVRKELKTIELPDDANRIYLYVQGECETYSFYYGLKEGEKIPVMTSVDGTLLSTNMAGGFVGAYLGMYASSNGEISQNVADFDWFEYFPFDN